MKITKEFRDPDFLAINLKTAVERRIPFDTPAARATQGERILAKLVTTPFVLSSAVSCAYRSMSGVATEFSRIKEKLKGVVIFDSRNFYEPSELRVVGKEYFSIGGK